MAAQNDTWQVVLEGTFFPKTPALSAVPRWRRVLVVLALAAAVPAQDGSGKIYKYGQTKPGVDLGNFSGRKQTDREYEALVKRIHDMTLHHGIRKDPRRIWVTK
jgi:hypothetical protein